MLAPLLLLLATAELSAGRQLHAPSLLETLCSLSRSLAADGIVLYGARAPGETGETLSWGTEARLLRGLALRRVPVAWAHLGAATPGGGHGWGRRPLAVLLRADHGTAAWLDQERLAAATWLVLRPGGELPESLGLALPPDGRLLEASPGPGLSVRLHELRPGLPRRSYGSWAPGAGLILDPGHHRVHLRGVRLSVAVVHNPPVTELRTVNGSLEVGGYFGNVWHILEKRLNFSSDYVVPEDQATGRSLDDESCRGMLGLVRCKKVDVALGAFAYGAHKPEAIQYSTPLLLTSYRIFMRRPRGDAMRWSDFLRPFSGALWACLAATLAGVALCLSLCHDAGRRLGNEEAAGPRRYGFPDALLAVYGAFCSQGQDVTPGSTPCRAAFITAYLTSVTILASYSAALISSITVTRASLPFADLEGILASGQYNFGVVNQSEIFFYFTDSDNSVFQQAYRQLVLRDPANLPPSCLAGLKRLCDRRARFTFMAPEDNVLALARELRCAVVALPTSWRMANLAFAVAAGSPYRAAFDRCVPLRVCVVAYALVPTARGSLRLLRDGGVLFKHRLYGRRQEGDPRPPRFTSVSLEAVAPILALLGAACAASLALLGAERRWHRRRGGGALELTLFRN